MSFPPDPTTTSGSNATVTFTAVTPGATVPTSFWKRAAAKAEKVARDPILRPVEIWAYRAALAFLAVKVGLDARSL